MATMARETKNILINSIAERHLRWAAKRWARGKMLDIGCGVKPYKKMFAPYVDQHIGLDHADTLHSRNEIDIEATAYEMPIADETFDTVLCSMVLEHLEEPGKALSEAHRVLKPGGSAIYMAPFIWHLHEQPRDFFRYSEHGLTHLFEKTGFEVKELVPLSGFWVTFGQLFVYYIYRFNRGPMRFVPIVPLVGLVVQGLAAVLDRLDRAEAWTWAYLIVAARPEQGGPAQ
ncbi:MAG: hypothetical protein BGO23_01190 [Solirubrobacterales bacterium 67-14]|nr:MAG: hypothetical protein BGO23_01190 [Solirubrobacterales bacterium 67-14]